MPNRPPVIGQQSREPRPPKRFGAPDKLRASVRWRKLAAAILRRDPLCRCIWCHDAGLLTPATEVHHIHPLATHPELAYHPAYLAGVASPCHHRITAMEAAGKDATACIVPLSQPKPEERADNATQAHRDAIAAIIPVSENGR